ncbi:hypothetical protein R3W88_016374 [Solanum pinnatisectum]|uniref:DUF7745 domain-containing protein n=1 Tax=Solanum pinnatisectum TaxID=50273 RepID=A0AAV9KXH6_9SOLN|nr:hypothetical protein R3W88_016374 [Solanum pinnatisectum]
MQINQNFPNIRMMTEVPRILKDWWGNIRVAYENYIMPHLGSLIDLLNVEANKSLITLMIEFWQPATMTFQFTDFEIITTLEEISQIDDLPLASRAPLTLRTTSGIGFLQSLGLIVGPDLRRVDEGWVNLDYLFKRFGHREIYDRFQQEFFISRVVSTSTLLPMVIYMFRGPVRVTIVPMILAEIFQSLSLCSRGYDHFRGSNLLLQIWVLEHFYPTQVENGTEVDLHNKIKSHAMRLRMWDSPNNDEGWRLFLTHLTGTVFSDDYHGIPIERINVVVQGWYGILDSGMGVESWYTPKYYTWFMMEGILLMMNQRKIWRKTQKRILENQLRRWKRIQKNI